MSRLTWDGTAEPSSRYQIVRRERGQQGNVYYSCSAGQEQQDWQLYLVDQYYSQTDVICGAHTYYILHTSQEVQTTSTTYYRTWDQLPALLYLCVNYYIFRPHNKNRKQHTHAVWSLLHLKPIRTDAVIRSHTSSSPIIVELLDDCYHLRWYSDASEYLPQEGAVNGAVRLLEI